MCDLVVFPATTRESAPRPLLSSVLAREPPRAVLLVSRAGLFIAHLAAAAVMASNGSHTATLSPTASGGIGSPLLSNPMSSWSSSAGSRHSASQVSKTYRQSSQLFLTRRLPEALSTLMPLITPSADEAGPDGAPEPAPVVHVSRTTRVKVWSLYLTILNAVLELDPNEGKDAFGAQEYRAICGKVRDGGIWEEVVRNGYHGVEGQVDSDVVINL